MTETTGWFEIHPNLVGTFLLINTTITVSTSSIMHAGNFSGGTGVSKGAAIDFVFPESPARGEGEPLMSRHAAIPVPVCLGL